MISAGKHAAVLKHDLHLVGLVDDVVIGHHQAGGIDDEAGAQRAFDARAVAQAYR
jgi:hypothetical protein